MSHIIDDIARILASSMPRREAMRMLTKTVGVGLLTMFGVEEAFGICRGFGCGAQCCAIGETCCYGGFTPPFCAPAGRQCCGDSTCLATETCCDITCCAPGENCINARCSASFGGWSLF